MANTWQIGFLAGAKPGVKKKKDSNTSNNVYNFLVCWFLAWKYSFRKLQGSDKVKKSSVLIYYLTCLKKKYRLIVCSIIYVHYEKKVQAGRLTISPISTKQTTSSHFKSLNTKNPAHDLNIHKKCVCVIMVNGLLALPCGCVILVNGLLALPCVCVILVNGLLALPSLGNWVSWVASPSLSW